MAAVENQYQTGFSKSLQVDKSFLKVKNLKIVVVYQPYSW